MKHYSMRSPRVIWKNLLFFIFTSAVTIAGIVGLLRGASVSTFGWALFTAHVVATGMSITVGYHRLFAHRTFEAHPVVEALALFFGAAAFEQSAMDWASQHREHHKHVDTDLDPYNIREGFFYAHIGWLIFWKHKIDHGNIKDLAKNPLVVMQDRHYVAWAVVSGFVVPTLFGAAFGHAWEAFWLASCARIVLVHHATFCINSVCHLWGKATYDIHASAKDHWFVAFLTNGEGYHNFHHRFSGDYRNGVRWYQWDPSKWLIALLSYVGLAKNLKRVSRFSILEARLAAERERVEIRFGALGDHPVRVRVQRVAQQRYDRLQESLREWEKAVSEWSARARRETGEQRMRLRHTMAEAEERFREHRRRWELFVRYRAESVASAA